jgi:predicted acylesterase/phospholipase RssA
MEPWHVQIAFQGGGAKLCALLAAAEAIQALEIEKQIKVTRVAGTSAGAIVACLLATQRPLTDVRAKLQSNGIDYVNMVIPRTLFVEHAYKLASGAPLFNENKLRKFLGQIFTFDGKQIIDLHELPIPTIVTAADILNGEKRVFGNEKTPNEKLIDVLAHSCALPFVFRTAAAGASLVDGGIVANLPADELVADEQKFGRVLAISFKREAVPEMPVGQFGYAKALFDTAINHSIERARAQIGAGAVHEINTHITTFDFNKAAKEGLGKHYEDVREQCSQWFKDHLRLLAKAPQRLSPRAEAAPAPGITFIPPPGADADLRSLTKAITDIYVREHHDTPVTWERTALIATLNSLHPPSDPRSKMADDLRQILVFRPSSDKPVGAIRIGLLSSGASVIEGLCLHQIHGSDGQPIDATLVPLRSHSKLDIPESDQLNLTRQVLFFFHPPVSRVSGAELPCTLTISDQMYNALPQLFEGTEYVELLSDRSETLEIADIVLYVPENCADLVLAEYRPDNDRHNFNTGRQMTNNELSIYEHPPNGFVVKGWRGYNLKQREILRVRVLPPPSARAQP